MIKSVSRASYRPILRPSSQDILLLAIGHFPELPDESDFATPLKRGNNVDLDILDPTPEKLSEPGNSMPTPSADHQFAADSTKVARGGIRQKQEAQDRCGDFSTNLAYESIFLGFHC